MYDFKPFKFSRGSHPTREDGTCYMECVAYLAGEPHSDHPECASPVITELAIWLNDSFRSDDEARQKAFEPISPLRIIGTRASDEIEQQRAFMAADFAVRFVCPRVLDRAGLHDHAETLRSLDVINGEAAAGAAAVAAAGAAAGAAGAAGAAARAAAYAAVAAAGAAANAAVAAAGAAANAADAAYAAYAAANAAYAAKAAANAACATAYDFDVIRTELVHVIDRMIRLTEPQEVAIETREVVEA